MFYKPEEGLAPLFAFKIENDTAFVAVGHQEEMAHPLIAKRRDAARDIAVMGFDFDYLGAVIAEDLSGVRTITYRRYVQYPDTVEGSRHYVSP